MTQEELQKAPTKTLLFLYKQKACCIYAQRVTDLLYNELMLRLSSKELYPLRVALFRLKSGDGHEFFISACDKLIGDLESARHFLVVNNL